MKIVVRADASSRIGSGHVMRCLALARVLRRRECDVSFVSREAAGSLIGTIAAQGFGIEALPAAEAGSAGDEWQSDARETRDALLRLGSKPDWLIVDHYGLDERWESAVRACVGRVMVIDDLAGRRHACDLLLDQNIVRDMHVRHAGTVPDCCPALIGPEYALLDDEYALLHRQVPLRTGPVRRVLVFFGAADTPNMTGRTLAALLRLSRPDVEVDLVVTTAGQADLIREQAGGYAHVHVHGSVATLAPLMARADLAVGAAGSTSWERLCLGLPALVVTLADHQRAIAQELSDRGLIRWLGHYDEVDDAAINKALRERLSEPLDEEWSRRSRAAVDGRGARRVASILLLTADTPVAVRRATVDDERLGSDWLGPPEFRRCLRDIEACRLYVVETTDDVAVGCVRFQRGPGDLWTIDHVRTPFAGRSLQPLAIDAALRHWRGEMRGALACRPMAGAAASARWRISVCSDARSWTNHSAARLIRSWLDQGHEVTWVHDAATLPRGDICFLLGYERIVAGDILRRHANNLVVHASALPKGRGMSPLTWQVLEGATRIPVTLLEAAEAMDSGVIYRQLHVTLSGTELLDQLRTAVSAATETLCREFVDGYPAIVRTGKPQEGEPTFYRRRGPLDSRLDPDRTLREQFNLLRTVDHLRYPAWFEIGPARFTVKVEKA